MRHDSQAASGKTTARPRPRLEELDRNQIASWKMSVPSGNGKVLLGIPGAAFAVGDVAVVCSDRVPRAAMQPGNKDPSA